MRGNFVDTLRLGKPRIPSDRLNTKLVETDFGFIRVFDTQGNKPVVLTAPDGPNVIEHHHFLISQLSRNFRVICFEFPGVGFSYPTYKYDYSFEQSASIILQVMDLFKIPRAVLCFSCSNGLYAIKAAEIAPDNFVHLFLTQTPSAHCMVNWVDVNIPKILTYPIIGQIVNSISERKLADSWYKIALPKSTDKSPYRSTALAALSQGGCFCLSSLVQGLVPHAASFSSQSNISSTLIWGTKDYSHRLTNSKSILHHLPNCEIVEFDTCGHFPELESTQEYTSLVQERFERLHV